MTPLRSDGIKNLDRNGLTLCFLLFSSKKMHKFLVAKIADFWTFRSIFQNTQQTLNTQCFFSWNCLLI